VMRKVGETETLEGLGGGAADFDAVREALKLLWRLLFHTPMFRL